VSLFALRRPARLKLRAREFQELREELLDLCETLANASDDPRRAAYYRGLAGLVRPFLSPSTLAQTDGEILLNLLVQCRRIDGELSERLRWRLVPLARMGLPLALGVAAFGLALILGGVEVPADWAPIAWLRHGRALLRLTVHRLSEFQKLLAVGILGVTAVFYLLQRSSRE
jgi:hypothetical protein